MKATLKRRFLIGSEWVYYKIYTGAKTADLVLTEIIKPLADELLSSGIISKWFFIRYADPKHHLRVRFHSNKTEAIAEIITRMHPYLSKFMEEDLIWKTQLDTYQREIERYGAISMEASEELFFYESQMIASFVDLIEGEDGEELRWLFGLRAIDQLLNEFNYQAESKLTLLESLKVGFGAEFNMSRPLKRQLDDKYRANSNKIYDFMKLSKDGDHDYTPLLELLEEKSHKSTKTTKTITSLYEDGKGQVIINDLMSSYIHMLMNRLFKSNNRLHEMVCYDFLYRYYKSVLARAKYTAKK